MNPLQILPPDPAGRAVPIPLERSLIYSAAITDSADLDRKFHDAIARVDASLERSRAWIGETK